MSEKKKKVNGVGIKWKRGSGGREKEQDAQGSRASMHLSVRFRSQSQEFASGWMHTKQCTSFERGSPVHRDTEAYEANETWRRFVGHTNLGRLGLTRLWRTDNNESRKGKEISLSSTSTNGGSRLPLQPYSCSTGVYHCSIVCALCEVTSFGRKVLCDMRSRKECLACFAIETNLT